MAETTGAYLDVEGLRLHYLTAGRGEPVVLLHGWPTSSFLWRNVMPPIAESNRVIALDLPGFGRSDKPLDASYSFRFFDRVLAALGIEATSLAVHDVGGPVGLYWACRRPGRVRRLAILNTLLYPEFSWAVVLFIAACRLPGLRSLMVSPWGLKQAMRFGVADRRRLSEEANRRAFEPAAPHEPTMLNSACTTIAGPRLPLTQRRWPAARPRTRAPRPRAGPAAAR